MRQIVDQRDWEQNKTILSGDIGSGSISDNSFTVLYAIDTGSNTKLDGFTIEGGNANSSIPLDPSTGPKKSGGGFYLKGQDGPTVMTINNCIFQNNYAAYNGGGVYLMNTYTGSMNALFNNCQFYYNTAALGGGISKFGGGNANFINEINNCIFEYNNAIRGGAIYILNTYGTNPIHITNSSFSYNSTTFDGGAISLHHEIQDTSTFTIENCYFEENNSLEGGALFLIESWNNDYSIRLFNNQFIRNNAVEGGAIFFNFTNPNILLKSCIFLYNNASSGGGGAIWGPFKEANNCIFAGNITTQSGACVYVHFAGQDPININFNNCTFYSNSAVESGGVFSTTVNSSPNAVYFNNSIFLDNTAGNGDNIGVAYTEVFLNNCLTAFDSCLGGIYLYPWGTALVECNNAMIYNQDPLFKDTANMDFSLLACSPAIDAGDNAYVADSIDLAGNDRIINGTVDIGAYEAAFTFLSIDNLTDAACFGENSGSVGFSYNGQAPFTTQWDNGMTTGTGTDSLAAGNYSLTITDANDCSETIDFEIEQTDSMSVSFTTQEVTCPDGNDGNASLTIQGGIPDYFISWSSGAIGDEANNLSGGWQEVTVFDGNNCELVDSVFIEEPEAISVFGDIINASTNNSTDGSIEIFNITGGTPPFQIDWSTGDTSALIENLAPEVYVVSITDSNGCIATHGFLVSFNTGVTFAENPEVIISPNPVEQGSGLKIELKNCSNRLKIDLYNTLGSLIQDEVLTPALNQISLKAPQYPGIYFLTIQQEGKPGTIKRIVVY